MSEPERAAESTWQQGADAFRRGVPRGANPYETQDLNNWRRVYEMNAWDNGWCAARENYFKEKSDDYDAAGHAAAYPGF